MPVLGERAVCFTTDSAGLRWYDQTVFPWRSIGPRTRAARRLDTSTAERFPLEQRLGGRAVRVRRL